METILLTVVFVLLTPKEDCVKAWEVKAGLAQRIGIAYQEPKPQENILIRFRTGREPLLIDVRPEVSSCYEIRTMESKGKAKPYEAPKKDTKKAKKK